ncbi:hypothetical protein [Cobetia sp. QF-1]|uniref:hypothetical protein n=1 Tax=Cobetia sp. QF-1 TaxID=1969833 RepID=UPI000B542A6C|nr:hypothetical protein [Cobetia sp. QF-1]
MLLSIALDRAIRKPPPARIPLSLPSASNNNFYSVELVGDNSKILVKEKGNLGFNCLVWQGEEIGIRRVLNIDEECYAKYSLRIEHYYRGHQFTYTSAVKFIFFDYIKWYKFLVLKDGLDQSLYNNRSIVREERMDVLNYLVEKKIENDKENFDSISMALNKKAHKWLYHPDKERYRAHLQLILDSFVESGDIKKHENGYRVTGKALITLSEYELNIQRHKDILKSTKMSNKISSAILLIGALGIAAQLFMWFITNEEKALLFFEGLKSFFY